MIAHLYITFALAMFPAAIIIRLWRHSVSTMIFVTASAWCAVTATPELGDESLRFAGLLLLELVAVVRAVAKGANDSIIPGRGRHV